MPYLVEFLLILVGFVLLVVGADKLVEAASNIAARFGMPERVIGLTVTGPDPQTIADVANHLVANVSGIAQEVMSVESVNPIDQATAPEAPSGPNRPLYVAVALMAGLFLAVAIVVVEDMLNTKVRGQEEVEELLGIPVIGRIPAMRGGR